MASDQLTWPDWRDSAAYAPLLRADRSFIAWEWLRRNPAYARAAAHSARVSRPDEQAATFGLVTFESPDRPVPVARPLWRSAVYPYVLDVDAAPGPVASDDRIQLSDLAPLMSLVSGADSEHLLLSDGFGAIRMDAPPKTFVSSVCLRYILYGVCTAEPKLIALRRLLALVRHGRLLRKLHPPERSAGRWTRMLRAHDALAAGANQRDIAAVLLSKEANQRAWRNAEPSLRSRAQRLVRGARAMEHGAWRSLLR